MESQTITVLLWDMAADKSLYILEMIVVPRTGERVHFKNKIYRVKDVEWFLFVDGENLNQVAIVLEEE